MLLAAGMGLPDVRESRTHDEAVAAAAQEERPRPAGDDRLQHHDRDEEREERQRLAGPERQVDEHADRDEEEAVEGLSQRVDLRHDLLRVDRLGHDHAREEGAERHREPELADQQRRAEDTERGDQREQLRAARLDSALGEEGKDVAREQQGGRQHRPGTGHDQQRGGDAPFSRSREQRQREENRDHGEILHQQDAEHQASLRSVGLASLLEQAQHHRRRADREEEAGDEGDVEVEAEVDAYPRGERRREHHLREARPEHESSQRPDLRDGDFHPHAEEQQDHADLREHLDLVTVFDDREPAGPEGRAGHHETDDVGNAQLAEQIGHDESDAEDEHDFAQDDMQHSGLRDPARLGSRGGYHGGGGHP